jgi:hypothetical protein
LVASVLQCYGVAALADPGYYVVTAYDNPGVRTIDFRYWTVKQPGQSEVIWPEIGLGLNVNGRWYTELLLSYIGSSQFATRLSTYNWQNDYLLTQGQYPFDLAIHTLYSKADGPTGGSAFELGPVIQTDVGRTQINLNVFFARAFDDQSSHPTELKYQWQLRHRWRPWLQFGVMGFGELGTWNDWAPSDAQSHRLGPALFGTVPFGDNSLAWQAGYLVGSIYGESGSMFTARVKYDF